MIAEPSFLARESSPGLLQRFIRCPETGLEEINGDLPEEDF